MSENNSFESNNEITEQENSSARSRWKSFLLRFLLGITLLSLTGYIALGWLKNRPRAERKKREVKAVLVAGKKIHIADYDVTIDAMGTVIPARTLDLASRVSGEIIRVSDEFFPGGRLVRGDLVVEIDKKDYKLVEAESTFALKKASLAIIKSELAIEQSELAIKQSEFAIAQREADVVEAEKDLKIELGQQKIAKREYEVLGEKMSEKDEELVLRRPQLEAAEAAVRSAKARLEEEIAEKSLAEAKKSSAEAEKKSAEAERNRAKVAIEKATLNLNRTDIRAPFNAVIQEKRAEIGSHVSIGETIAKIVDSDEYWVQVSIPVDRLKWINIPKENGSKETTARIFHESAWGKGVYRTATVKRLMTDVEKEGRMAKLLISTEDPLSMKAENADKPKMILGSYVRVEIDGKKLNDVVRVSRSSIHDRDRIWTITPENTLDIREVDIVWSDNGFVYIRNSVKEGEMLIVSDLSTPVQGMSLRLADSDSTATEVASEEVVEEKQR